MSLFKVRDFWAFDLSGLHLDAGESTGIDLCSDPDEGCQEGTFTASVGRFNSIGKQDVFVCANLQGSIYILQVPAADQRKYIKSTSIIQHTGDSSADSGSSQSRRSTEERQLLAATNLEMPIVDVKCGYFVSAVKQSIAVLSFDKLLILQVRRHEVLDLMTDSEIDVSEPRAGTIISPSQLSHEFEEHLRLDLLANEFACGLVVLNSHADGSLKDASLKKMIQETNDDLFMSRKSKQETSKFIKHSKQVVQQLHLPQRDKLIVQYANQFLFSLIDEKKITGHFSMSHPQQETSLNGIDPKTMQMSQSTGAMPVAYLHNKKTSPSVVFSFSDYRLHCVPLEKLVSQARRDVMKKVASNLLHNGRTSEATNANDKILSPASSSGRVFGQPIDIVSVDIESVSEWTHEMLAMPLQMSSEQRQARNVTAAGHKNDLFVSQLLVMSRYSLDLFSACGQHLWSQRFETPLIGLFSYVLESRESEAARDITICGTEVEVQFCDKLISLLSTDSLSAGKSNLLVLSENQVQWSAFLDAKPFKIWRLNLTHMPGLLAMLDVKLGQLVVSYLGTNSDLEQHGDEDATETSPEDVLGTGDITKLETLDDPLLTDDELAAQEPSYQSVQSEQRRRLTFEVSLEASGEWPNVAVEMHAAFSLDPESTGVIYNIEATLEYDDLFRFDVPLADDQSIAMWSQPSTGVTKIRLGNCWPDRKEPIYLKGTFNLLHAQKRAFGVTAMEELESNMGDPRMSFNSTLVPKSMKVLVYLTYHETHSSLLVQDESFLLPISMISQLTHIDYTNGSGQNIDDVLNNLTDYKTTSGPYRFCDLFLKLDLDLVEFLNEFVERDLVCRRVSSAEEKMRMKRNKSEAQIETLENINLLAQSLDCRLRYKNFGGIARQSSEEIIVPAMVSFAIRMNATHPSDIVTDSTRESCISRNVVWIHLCDLNSGTSSLAEEFVMRHMKDWMQFHNGDGHPEAWLERAQSGNNNLLISIECEESWPLMLALDHISERAGNVGRFDARTAVSLIGRNENVYESIRQSISNGHHVAISNTLHDSLRNTMNSYETDHKDRFRTLRDRLARDECKFYIVTKAILSLSKRLPSVSDEMRAQLANLSALLKHYQQSIASTLNELSWLKETDLQLSKLPYVPSIEVTRLDKSGSWDKWPRFDRLID